MTEKTSQPDDREMETAIDLIKGLHDQLLYVADYFELKGMMTQEETRRLDTTRQQLAAKIMQLKG